MQMSNLAGFVRAYFFNLIQNIMQNLLLNYQELAFIADIPLSKSKELFKKKL